MSVKKLSTKMALFIVSVFLCADISALVTLRCIDHTGDEIAQAAINAPFIVEVSVESTDGDSDTPEVTGIKQFIVQDKTHASTVNTIINGRRSVQKVYRFFVQATHEGTYTIGPAVASVRGAVERSEAASIAIVKQIAAKPTEPVLRLRIDREQVFIGEQVQCTIQFFMGKGTRLEGVTQPHFPDCTATKLEGPFSGKKEIDGVMRDCVEWRTMLTPQKVGPIAIPSTSAVYKTMSDRRSPSMFGFSFIFDDPFEQKQLFSNAVQLQVEPLPESSYQSNAFGVGQFKLASLKTEVKTAAEGEGIVVRATVMGHGTILRFPLLQLPDGLKYYESKQFIEESKSTTQDKAYVFEYIVQSIKPGNFTIDAQEWASFDPYDKKYHLLRTDPFSLTVNALQKKSKKEGVAAPAPQQPDTHKQTDHTPEQQSPLVLSRTWASHEAVPFNWTMFYILALIVGTIGACIWAFRWYRWYQVTYAGDITARRAFKKAREALKKSRQAQRPDELYMIFITLFVHRFHVTPADIDEQFMQDKLRALPEEERDAWSSFYATVLRMKFSSTPALGNQKDIFEKAERWLTILEKTLS
ncbi:MAG: BatD family protein [Candidatus Babeliales bacterium]